MAETLSVGHGSVETFPDRPHLEWEYEPVAGYTGRRKVYWNNLNYYMQACEGLYGFFRNYNQKEFVDEEPEDPIGWNTIRSEIHVMKAAWEYRGYVLHDLLEKLGLVIY